MTLTTSSRIVMRGIGCTLILLLELSAQAIDYEVYIHDTTPTKLRNDIALTSRDFLERFDFINPKTSYTLQEGTEYWLHFGAFLRTRILDTFGDLLYIHYDDFSIAEVDALYKVYRMIHERRYHMFDLVPDILRNPDTRPSRICAAIYAHADSCLKNSASVCHRIRKQHDRSHSGDLNVTALNIAYSVYRSSRISKYYPRGFSLLAVLKLLQRGALIITPSLLSGLLHNARYDNLDDDVRLAERELVRYFNEVQRSSGQSFMGILKPLPFRELKKFRSADSFLKYYVSVHAESFPDDNLRRHASLIAKRIVGDDGTIDENIHLLGNVYENGTIHVGYLFDLVLPDDVLNEDIVEAKRYLAKRLDELDIVERYLKVQKYQQATPAKLAMEITGQLKDIGFAQDIATALRIHARFWRRSRMIESLDELLVLFDAYENLRRVPRYRNMMENIDQIRKSLWDTRDVPVEILCNAPRACLRIGLQTVLQCRFVNPEIKALIGDFLRQVTLKGALLADECLVPIQTTKESRRAVDISFKVPKMRLSTTAKTTKSYLEDERKMSTAGTTWVTGMETTKIDMTVGETTPRSSTTEQDDRNVTTETWESYESKETTETVQVSNEITEELSTESKTSSEENMESASTTTITPKVTKHIEYEETIEPILATTTNKMTLPQREETTAATTSTVAATTTIAQTTTTKSPTTTTTIVSPTMPTTTVSPTTTTTTVSPTTTTTVSPTITTTSPTTTTMLPTSTTSRITTTTASHKTTTAESLTSTTTTPTTVVSTSPITTVAISSIITDEVPDIEMGLKRSKTFRTVPVLDDENLRTEVEKISETTTTFVTSTPPRACETGECNSERRSEETARYETSTMLTLKTQAPTSTVKENVTSTIPTTQAFTFIETTRLASSELASTQDHSVTDETTVATTESSKTPVTEGEACTESSCSEECTRSNSESTERPRCAATDCSGKSCSDTDCDSLMSDCDDEDISERPQNHTVKCSRIRCEKESPEVSSGCETGISGTCEDSECTSKDEEGSAECVKLCVTQEKSSPCGDQDDCTSAERSTIDVKFERTRNRSMCEIRDPHHRRQLRRLAKMRAIGAATSRTDDTRTRMSRERIATKKIYDLLATGLPRFKNERSRKTAGYLLKRSLGTVSRSIEADGGKGRKQRDQIYRLRKELARRIGRKSMDGRSKYRSGRTPIRQRRNERISRRGAKSIRAARERAIGDRNASI